MKCENLFREIDGLNETYIKVWEDCCNLESPTLDKARVDAVGRYFIDLAEKKGWKVEIQPQEKAGDSICITMNPDAPGKPISLSGHLDTVHPVGSFGTPAVRIEGEKIYGPGVTDCKGGVVAGFMAMDALERAGFQSRPVMLLLQTDEEVGSRISNKATIGWICEKSKEAEAFLNLEGYSVGKVTTSRKGIAAFALHITGVEAHAAKCAEAGANAIVEAAHIALKLHQWRDAEGITCNCGVIQGGTVTNTVPKSCVLKVDFRYKNMDQLEEIRALLKEIEEHPHIPGCTCKVEPISFRIAMERTQRNLDLLAKVNQIYGELGMPELQEQQRGGGSDGADVTHFGIPCLDSFGVEGDLIHNPGEFARLASLSDAAKRIAAIVYCL